MHFHQAPQPRLFLARQFLGTLEVQGAQKIPIVFAQAEKFDVAGLASELFELMQTLFVHSLSRDSRRQL